MRREHQSLQLEVKLAKAFMSQSLLALLQILNSATSTTSKFEEGKFANKHQPKY